MFLLFEEHRIHKTKSKKSVFMRGSTRHQLYKVPNFNWEKHKFNEKFWIPVNAKNRHSAYNKKHINRSAAFMIHWKLKMSAWQRFRTKLRNWWYIILAIFTLPISRYRGCVGSPRLPLPPYRIFFSFAALINKSI